MKLCMCYFHEHTIIGCGFISPWTCKFWLNYCCLELFSYSFAHTALKFIHNVCRVFFFFLLRKWRRLSASSSQQIFPKKSIFPQAINFSPRNQFSLCSYKVTLRDLVNRPTPSPKDQLQSWLRWMLLTFSLFDTSHPSSKFGENRSWSDDFVSCIHCGADFPEHACGMIRITLDPSNRYLARSRLRKRDNQQCLPACKFCWCVLIY